MKTLLVTIIAILIYRLIERIDGEKGLKIIPYTIGQNIKMKALEYVK